MQSNPHELSHSKTVLIQMTDNNALLIIGAVPTIAGTAFSQWYVSAVLTLVAF